MDARFISGTKEIMWKDNHSVGGTKRPCCERLNSIPNKYKLFALLSIIVIQGVVIISYKQGCHSTLCLQEQTLKLRSGMNQLFSYNDNQDSPSSDRVSSTMVESEIQFSGQKKDSLGDGESNVDRNHFLLPRQDAGPAENQESPLYNPNSSMTRRLPHFIVIGVKKSGSRAILSYLSIHPDVVVSGSEVHFFDRPENYAKGMDWYLQQMPLSKPHMLTGEKSPAYYRTDNVPERIHAMNSSIKLLCIVKEPISRAMSNYLQFRSKSLERGEADYPTFEESILSEDGTVNPNAPHIYNSDYNRFLSRWLKYFPREQLLFVDGNLLIKDPAKAMKRVQSFLGVRQYINESYFQFDEKKGFFCYREDILERFACLDDTKGREHPPINPDTRLLLSNYFKPRNIMFFRNIGETFDWDT